RAGKSPRRLRSIPPDETRRPTGISSRHADEPWRCPRCCSGSSRELPRASAAPQGKGVLVQVGGPGPGSPNWGGDRFRGPSVARTSLVARQGAMNRPVVCAAEGTGVSKPWVGSVVRSTALAGRSGEFVDRNVGGGTRDDR